MQFNYYNEIDINSYHLSEPIYDELNDIYMCKLTDTKNKEIRVKSSSMRLLDLIDNNLRLEFIHTSNDFYQFVNNLDNYLKEGVKEQLSKLLENINKDTLDNLFKSSINLPDKLPSLPFMKFKLDSTCKFAANRRRKISIESLKQNTEIEIHLFITGVNLYKNKYEVIYNVHQVKLIGDYSPSLVDLLTKNPNEDDGTNENIEYVLDD